MENIANLRVEVAAEDINSSLLPWELMRLPDGSYLAIEASQFVRMMPGIGSKFRWMRSTPTESVSTKSKLFVCLAKTGVKSPRMAKATDNGKPESSRNGRLFERYSS